MAFSRVRFYNFRNLSTDEISLNSREIFLIGPNGQGKTNFLEGIYLLCYGTSFRTKLDRHLLKTGEKVLSARAEYDDPYGKSQIKFVLDNGKKEIRVNDTAVRDRKEIIRNLPCIAYIHEDFLFINGSPDHQRFFFDQTLSLYNPLYIENLRNYRKLLKSRNLLLKQGDATALSVFEDQLASAGLLLMEERKNILEDFNQVFCALFQKVTGLTEPLQVTYLPSWKGRHKEEITATLAEKREFDRQMGSTTTGPHRDRYRFELNSKDYTQTASTGQIRLLSLLLRSAQAGFFHKKTGRKPILLLDDVLLELDGEKRRKFLENLPEYDQAFFTFLPEEPIYQYGKDKALIFQVREGMISHHE